MIERKFAATAGAALIALLAGCAQPGPVARTGVPTAPIASVTVIPAGYETIYVSGMTGTLPAPPGGGAAPDSGDTEAQAVRALDKIKAALAEQGLGLGDVVMMHAYLAPDAQGRGDSQGWSKAYTKYFGTADQPNKPSRSTITVGLGPPATKIEIETIAVRKPKA